MIHIRHRRHSALPLALALFLASPSGAADKPGTLSDLSLEDLMQVEVTSVSKKPQRLANVAASVHVISAEDIRLAGANSIPEALRLAPGIDATRISGNRWAVSARGSADLYANKLLVMVDGRNAYNPAFSGVAWQDFQFPIEDIERIEVIRGPAAAVWGSNGVNGVINIITKSAASTQGGQVVLGAGKGEYGRAHWGGASADGSLYYRAYVSSQHADSQRAIPAMGGGDGGDAFNKAAAGLRLDGYLAGGARWDLSADFYDDRDNGTAYFAAANGAGNRPFNEKHRGTTLRGRYEKALEGEGNLQVQGAFAHSELEIPYMLIDSRDTLDFDLQHRFRLGEGHDVIWGANYRRSRDEETATAAISVNTPSRQLDYYGLSAQDEIALMDTLHLTLGLRMDHNEMTGWEAQPTARLSWNLHPNQTLWGSLSRASRAPSRGERGFNFNKGFVPGTPFPSTLIVLRGDENFGSEGLKAEEIGLRSQWIPNLSTDAVIFHHHYDQLRLSGTPGIDATHFPLIITSIPIINGGEMALRGVELSADWRISSSWRLQLAQTWNDPRRIGMNLVDLAGQIPRHISSLRASWAPAASINLDAWFRRTDARPALLQQELLRNAFSAFDLRAAWRPRKDVELSLAGQNLGDGECKAYDGLSVVRENENIIPTCQPRRIIGQVRFEF
ncbi:MAG: TonB-dependent receptor [Proteobacteria bacterium]|nr:TonB-dependent receptor [Pseudomonadota bacterium]